MKNLSLEMTKKNVKIKMRRKQNILDVLKSVIYTEKMVNIVQLYQIKYYTLQLWCIFQI